jgi:hypothetical protein
MDNVVVSPTFILPVCAGKETPQQLMLLGRLAFLF